MSNNWKPEAKLPMWKVLLGIAVFLFFMGLVGSMDFYTKRSMQCERKGLVFDWKHNVCLKEMKRK